MVKKRHIRSLYKRKRLLEDQKSKLEEKLLYVNLQLNRLDSELKNIKEITEFNEKFEQRSLF